MGVPAFGFRDFLNRTFHAIQDTKTPFRVACLVVALNITLNLILRKYLGARGLALATSISSYVGMIAMLILLRRQLGRLGLTQILPEMVKLILSALAAAAVCFTMAQALPTAGNTLQVFGRLAAVTAVSFITYLVACLLLRVKALGQFTGMLRRRNAK